MDNIKMPFLPEETLRTQRVEVYLNDLKERLKGLRHQHDEVIQQSVDIIKEIDAVSSTLLLPQNSEQQDEENFTKIKKLIQEFETATAETEATSSSQKTSSTGHHPVAIESKVDIRKILENFEQLNESHVLKESLVLFKRAKESFEKIDTFFDKLANSKRGGGVGGIDANRGVNSSLKKKINMFNGGAEVEVPSRYASCCSSAVSLDTFRSIEEIGNNNNVNAPMTNMSMNYFENGYDGDNDDSEYDLFAVKKKRSKCLPPNV